MLDQSIVESIAAELHLRGIPVNRAALLAFLADARPLVEDDPDPVRWAKAFAEATIASAVGRPV